MSQGTELLKLFNLITEKTLRKTSCKLKIQVEETRPMYKVIFRLYFKIIVKQKLVCKMFFGVDFLLYLIKLSAGRGLFYLLMPIVTFVFTLPNTR